MLNNIRKLWRREALPQAVPVTSPPLNVGAEDRRDISFGDFAIDQYRPIKVIVIGAGMCGILAGLRFRQRIQNLNLTIYEKEERVGGTWYVNKYPGIACDIPAHCYQYSFENKGDWSSLYAPGEEIQEHLESIVARYKLEPYLNLSHELTHARYDEQGGKWHVTIKRPSSTNPDQLEEFEDDADLLFMGTGILNRWKWPDIDGLHEFKGPLVHSANWNLGGKTWEEDVKDWHDKSIAVIGLGSSALQIVSALQDKVGQISQYARGKTWVCPPLMQNEISGFLNRDVRGDKNFAYTEEEKKAFREDPGRVKELRRLMDSELNKNSSFVLRDDKLQTEYQETFREHMTAALTSHPEIAEQLIPDFSVCGRRLTPAPGYLKALCRDHISLVGTDIKRITPDGIETVDGKFTKHDVIICATGFDVSYRFPFSMIGRDGVDLRDKWSPHPTTYMSLCVDGFPNCFFCNGPNSCFATGVLIPVYESLVDYIVEAAGKMQRERLKSIEVKAAAVKNFDALIEEYFPKTVFTENVRSWYKMGKAQGRVVGLWPGTSLHFMRAIQHPRWEDYEYEYEDDAKHNFLFWMGSGITLNEATKSGNATWYLDDDRIDVPSIPN